MKQYIIFLFLFSTLTIPTLSQERKDPTPEMQQRMKVEKISFIANQLELTPQEAQLFWPIYNESEQKRYKLEKEKQTIEVKAKANNDSISQKEYQLLCLRYVALAEEEASIINEYNKQLLKVLPANKVLRLYFSERKFRTHMLQEYKRRIPKQQE